MSFAYHVFSRAFAGSVPRSKRIEDECIAGIVESGDKVETMKYVNADLEKKYQELDRLVDDLCCGVDEERAAHIESRIRLLQRELEFGDKVFHELRNQLKNKK